MTALRSWGRWAATVAVVAAAFCAPRGAAAQNLTVNDVERIIAGAVAEARSRGKPASIAVVDRVGNVLAVFQMNGAPARVRVTSKRGIPRTHGLEQVEDTFVTIGAANSPSSRLSAIAKAVTGAYLSSSGNAFTTRTASQIVQEHFSPGELFAPSGPLFGVQFSQLPCSDLSVRQATNGVPAGVVSATLGPKRSPLGLSADPGGLPLYKNNVVVGGIGVEADGFYTLDNRIEDYDFDVDEVIAIAGQQRFEPDVNYRANRIFVDGRSLRYTDTRPTDLQTNPVNAPAFATITGGVVGDLANVQGYFSAAGGIVAGQTYGQAASGFAADPNGTFNFVGQTVFVLFSGGVNRFPPTASTTPTVANGGLTANEVATILGNALKVAFAGRAQIRRPLNSHIQVTVSVVDASGNVLGMARTPDAPIFGTDVSLQKARSAAFFSNPAAAAYFATYDASGTQLAPSAGQNANGVVIANFLSGVRNVLGPNALSDGIAFGARTIGNLARPFLPDGFEGAAAGPLSRPFDRWSIFNTGFQLDTVFDNIALHVRFADAVGGAIDTGATCTFFTQFATNLTRLSNGLQIFAGSVPVYRRGVLIGGVGVSGDGVDQDDMVGFLGLNDASGALGTGFSNAPHSLRADRFAPGGANLRYVQCPFKPFLNSRHRNACDGK
ncbi:MAG: hypothetical protein EXQ86_03670 [Rhodospirillales bacterium]|nr:hypothetical protein [Rhodospirillales bacterium]